MWVVMLISLSDNEPLEKNSLADPKGALEMPAPGLISFIFMQFSAQKLPNKT